MERLEILEKQFGNLQNARNLALDNDARLLEFLLNHEKFQQFFVRLKDTAIFKQNEFLQFLDLRLLGKSYTAIKASAPSLAQKLDKNLRLIKQDTSVVLNFPFKDCVLKGGQSRDEVKSEEIFFNEILARDEIDVLKSPKVLCNFELINGGGGGNLFARQRDDFVESDSKNEIASATKSPRNDGADSEIVTPTPRNDGKNGNDEISCVIASPATAGRSNLAESTFEKIKTLLESNKFNLLLKGNNYCALNSLKARFANSVKLIYIDPPYNTGNDSFNYNDRFNHSTWLVFMKNRLEIARELLRDDGVIFIQCDDNEQAYLKVLCDEIFGRENFVATVCVKTTPNARDYGHIGKTHEYIHLYAKSYINLQTYTLYANKQFSYKDKNGEFNIHPLYNSNVNFNIDNRPNLYYPFYVNPNKIDENGFYEISLDFQKDFYEVYPPLSQKDKIQFVWRWGKEKSCENLNIEIVGHKVKNEFRIVQKMRTTEKIARSIWDDSEFSNRNGTENLQKLFGSKIFAYPKSEFLLKRIIEISTNENDLILDFFAGSGTTLAVAHKMNRRYIGIEQMDYIESITKERLKKVIAGESGGVSKALNFQGGGSVIYAELLALNALYKEKIKDSKNILETFDEVRQKAFLDYRADFEKEFGDFENLNLEAQKELLLMALDSNMDYLPLDEIRDSRYELDSKTIELNKIFYKKD